MSHFSLERALSMAVSKAKSACHKAEPNGATSTKEQEYLNILEYFKKDLQPIFNKFAGGIKRISVETTDPYTPPSIYRITIELTTGKHIAESFVAGIQSVDAFKAIERVNQDDPIGYWRGTTAVVLEQS